MEEQEMQPLSERVASLETAFENLQKENRRLSSEISQIRSGTPAVGRQPAAPTPIFVERKIAPTPPSATAPPPAALPVFPPPPKPKKKSAMLPEHMRKSEYWLNKIGIGLILFAVVFLFKYSIDQGWLTPPIRILFGLALGTALLVIGFRIYGRKKHFSQVLTGGAIATYYITGFAAFQLFSLVSYPVALGFMIGVTIFSFFVSLRQDEAVFSLIGTLGGLGTPFLLYTESGTVTGLVIYTCLILAGTAAVYFYQGWRLLLWLSIIGGWLVLMIGLSDAAVSFGDNSANQWALGVGVIVSWLLFWTVPIFREVARVTNPGRWRKPLVGIGDNSVFKDIGKILDTHIFLIAIVVPYISLALLKVVWPELTRENWGWIIMGLGAVYWLVNLYLRRQTDLKNLAFTHTLLSLLFLTISLSLLLKGDTLLVALASEAAVLQLVALRISSRGISIFAHVLFGICGLLMIDRLYLTEISLLMGPSGGSPIFNARALTDLYVLSLGLFISTRFNSITIKRHYFLPVAAFLALWFCRELDGNIEFVVILAEAVILHFVARWKNDRFVAGLGHVFFGIIAVWLAFRMAAPDTDATAILNMRAMVNLLPIIAAAGMYRWLKTAIEIFIYRLVAHAAFLAWFVSEFISRENGQGYITIAWGIYAALLLVAGLRLNHPQLRTVSMTTIFIVVAKLFLVDLAELEVLWRILLFMGFGGLFLFLSYYFQDLWKAQPKSGEDKE